MVPKQHKIVENRGMKYLLHNVEPYDVNWREGTRGTAKRFLTRISSFSADFANLRNRFYSRISLIGNNLEVGGGSIYLSFQTHRT